jgi:nitrite reductase/ring-hydroxylating ferredoxin subunit
VSLVRIDGPGIVTSEDGRRFVVLALPDGLRVADAVCPHNGGPLEQGWLRDGTTLVCPWHWYRFDLDTGACETAPQHPLGVYPVHEDDGGHYADVGEPARTLSWSERLRAHARE